MKLSIVFVAVLGLTAFGCKKKEEKATAAGSASGATAAAAGTGDCEKAVTHSMDLSKADMQKMGTDDKTIAKMVELGIQHCKDDKWSAAAVKCMLDSKAMGDSQGCYGMLTPDQQDKMNKAAMSLAPDPAKSGSAGSAEAAGSGPAGSAAAGSGSGSATP